MAEGSTVRDRLQRVIASGEGYRTEFKEGYHPSMGREMVAFANSRGGKIYIGVSDSGQIVGADVSNKIRSQINDLARNCDPRIPITVQVLEKEKVLVVSVKSGRDKPYKCTDGFYIRSGASSQKMTRDEIKSFMQSIGTVSFDGAICLDFSYQKHFSEEKLRGFLRKLAVNREMARHQGNNDLSELSLPRGGFDFNFGQDWGGAKHKRNICEILQNLAVVRGSVNSLKFNNAGVLFFAEKLHEFYIHTAVDCALFKGTDKLYIIDRKTFNQDLLANIDSAMAFLHRHLNLSYHFPSNKIQREESLEIPIGALREAVVNAVTHRDYFDDRATVKVEIYDDRVEIDSIGGLPSGLSKRAFAESSRSIARNPLLADLMLRAGYIEKMGTGIRKMQTLTAQAGLPPVQFKIDKAFVTVIFRRLTASAAHGSL